VIPEFCLPSETSEFDHRECEIETIFFGFLNDFFVQLEAGHVLRSGCGNKPAIVSNGNEDTDFHFENWFKMAQTMNLREIRAVELIEAE
jgi:hypothetical protein